MLGAERVIAIDRMARERAGAEATHTGAAALGQELVHVDSRFLRG
jgi:hypothetical protein